MATPTLTDNTTDVDPSSTPVDGLFRLIVATAQAMTTKYPNERDPFQRVTKLSEETGEVAEQVNIWAGTGIKRDKHGEFDPQKLAAEICDVLRVAAGIAVEFDIVALVTDEIRAQHARAVGSSDNE